MAKFMNEKASSNTGSTYILSVGVPAGSVGVDGSLEPSVFACSLTALAASSLAATRPGLMASVSAVCLSVM